LRQPPGVIEPGEPRTVQTVVTAIEGEFDRLTPKGGVPDRQAQRRRPHAGPAN
jgi:hypothetical protein